MKKQWLTLILPLLLACQPPSPEDNAGERCADQLTSLAALCPAGTAARLAASGDGSCDSGASLDGNILGPNGEITGRCVRSGACELVCEVIAACPCGAERITREEVICASCDRPDLGTQDADRDDQGNPDLGNQDVETPDQGSPMDMDDRDQGAQDLSSPEPDIRQEPDEPPEPTCPEIMDCRGLQCGPDPICSLSCGQCQGDAVCNDQGRCEDPPEPGLSACLDVEDFPEQDQTCVAYCQSQGQRCVETCEGDPDFSPGGTLPYVLAQWCVSGPEAPPLRCNAGPWTDFASAVRCCCQ